MLEHTFAQDACAQTAIAFVAAAQVVPHVPQLFGSKSVSVHEPEQTSSVDAHDPAQAPSLQTSPVAQALLQAPQFAGSTSVFVQVPLQSVDAKPVQLRTHAPFVQTSPVAQALLHAPQCARSAFVSRHDPPHSVRPVAQTTAQLPALQT